MPEPSEPGAPYDETEPIVCTISAAEVPGRVELIGWLHRALTSVERTSTGLLLHFPDAPAVRENVEAVAVDEQRCCRFWGFAVDDQRHGVTLRWDGPPAAGPLLDRLHTYFTSDAPTALPDGLL